MNIKTTGEMIKELYQHGQNYGWTELQKQAIIFQEQFIKKELPYIQIWVKWMTIFTKLKINTILNLYAKLAMVSIEYAEWLYHGNMYLRVKYDIPNEIILNENMKGTNK